MSYLPTTFKADYTDVIVQLMAETQDEYAALDAVHGSFGLFDDLRKVQLSYAFLRCRADATPPDGADRWTDKLLDAAAHTDASYIAFLMQGLLDRNRFKALGEVRAQQAAEVGVQNHNAAR